jgi:conjugal transfer pilus assembly protein TrbC
MTSKVKNLVLISFLTAMLSPVFSDENHHVLVFVSFSMPKESLKTWIRDANIIHAPVVIRGLVNNSFKETITSVNALTKEGASGVQIDPTSFTQFEIKHVPAVVVVASPKCAPNLSCREDYDVQYGDVGLSYALKQIARRDDSLSPFAEDALKLLNKASHA